MYINVAGSAGGTQGIDWSNVSLQMRLGLDILKEQLDEELSAKNIEISTFQTLRQAIEEMDEDGQQAVEDYGEELIKALQTNAWDARRLAEIAPAELKQLAEQNEIDLVGLLRDLKVFIAALKTELAAGAYDSTGASLEELSDEDILGMIGAMFTGEQEGSIEVEA